MRILKGALLTLAAITAVTQQSFAQSGYYKGLFTGFAVGNMYIKDGFDYVADGGNGAVAGLAGYSMTSGSQQYSAYFKAANVNNNATTATREVTAAGMMIAPMGSTGIEFGSGISYSDFDGNLSNNAKFATGFRWKTGSLLMNLTGGYNTNFLGSGNAYDMGHVFEYQYGRISLIGNYGAAAFMGYNNIATAITSDKSSLRYGGGSIDYRFKFRLPMVARVSFQGTTSPTVQQTRSMVSLRTALSGNAGTLNSLSQSPWPTNLGAWSSLGF